MRRSRFTEERTIGILKEHGEAEQPSIQWIDGPPNGVAVSDLCREHGVGDANINEWKTKFGGMEGEPEQQVIRCIDGSPNEAKRLRALEDESTQPNLPGKKW